MGVEVGLALIQASIGITGISLPPRGSKALESTLHTTSNKSIVLHVFVCKEGGRIGVGKDVLGLDMASQGCHGRERISALVRRGISRTPRQRESRAVF